MIQIYYNNFQFVCEFGLLIIFGESKMGEEEELPSEEEIKKQIDEAMKIAEKKRKEQATKVGTLDDSEYDDLEKHIDEKSKKSP